MEADGGENVTAYAYDYGVELIRHCRVEDFSRVTGASFVAISCLSLAGNAVLLCGLTRLENVRRVTTLLLLGLAGFDVTFALTLPFWAVDHLHRWVFGEAACRILTGAYFVGIYGSLVLLTAMTVDRFLVVVVRSRRLTQRLRRNCARAAIAGSWVIGVAGSAKDALASAVVSRGNNVTTCAAATPGRDDAPGYLAQLSLLFVVPLAVIVLCYGMILYKLMSTSGRRKYWSVLVILAIVVAFVVCWGPYHVLMIVMGQPGQESDCEATVRHNRGFLVCRILAYSHCCINPMLFLLRDRFRRTLSRYLLCSPKLRGSSHRDEPSEPSHPGFYQNRASVTYQQNNTEFKTLGDS